MTSTIRTTAEFIAYLEEELKNRTVTELAKKHGINTWHINQFTQNPDYKPSRRIRGLCNIRDRKPDQRVIIYAGSDMQEKAQQLEELTSGEYTITKKE